MKALMIVYNQAHNLLIMEALDKCNVRGFTKWEDVQGRGTFKGEPHYGTHAWPSKNMTTLAILEEEKLQPLLKELQRINNEAEKQGLRAFVWDSQPVI